MKNRYCLLIISGVLLIIIGSCDIFNKAETSLIPDTGKNPIPDIIGTDYRNEIKAKGGGGTQTVQISWGKVEPLLKRIQARTNHRYVAFYSVQESDNGIYTYRTSPLAFSQEAVRQANGNIQPYFFESAENFDAPVQLLAAYIPDSRQAEEEMLQWILSKPEEGTVFKRQGEMTDKNRKVANLNSSEMCFVPDVTYYIYNENGDLMWTIVVGHNEPCMVVTPPDGGVSSGGGGSGENGIPCPEQLLPPPECDNDPGLPPSGGGGTPPPIFTCDTNGTHPVLDNASVQQAMDAVWLESYGLENMPLPHNQRNEAMFLVYATSSGYEIEHVPAGPLTSSCRFDGTGISVSSNIVALIHTHPYSDGDIINDARCGSGSYLYNGDGVSPGDESLMEAFINQAGYYIPFYVMDKNKIRIIQPSNPSQYDETINRCGY